MGTASRLGWARRLAVAATAAGTAVTLAATAATAATGGPVVLHGRTVSTPVGHHLAHKRTLVTGLSGVAAGPAKRIVTTINTTTKARLSKPQGGLDIPAEIDDFVSLVRADARYVTVAQAEYQYYFGGAHGESATVPLTFDRRTGALLTLHRFAAKGKEKALLHALSVATRSALKRRGVDPLAFTDGTAPKYANFAAFEPLPAGLLLEFPQGAVDFEAAGPQTVLVHWATLRGLVGLPRPTAS